MEPATLVDGQRYHFDSRIAVGSSTILVGGSGKNFFVLSS